ncbi:SHOCT domain-containing protein [Alicyclobacillus tolerans]|nr:SHOCT domain-containing protein [Alicyclobacillus tolerans]
MGSRRFRHESALQILQERYVSGEIDEETFRRMKNELNK